MKTIKIEESDLVQTFLSLIKESRPFQVAKDKSHEYLMERWVSPKLHNTMRILTQECGYEGKFYSTTYQYYNLGEYKYWVIEDVLNREKLPLIKP